MKTGLKLILLISIFSFFSCQKNISTQPKKIKEKIKKQKLELKSNKFEHKIKKLTEDLKSKYSNKNNKIKKLAVMPLFNEGSQRSHLGLFVSNTIQEYIFDTTQFDLLERERVDSMLQEHAFSQSGLVRNNFLKKLGDLHNTDIILLGTIFQQKESFKIVCRIVNIETGTILSIASTNVNTSPVFEKKFRNIIKPKIISLTGAYEFIIKEIIVKNRKLDGRTWDHSPSNPDIYYIIRKNNKQIFPTYTLNGYTAVNVLRSSFEHVKVPIIFKEDDVLEIVVRDQDHLEDDFIGNLMLPSTKILKIINEEKNNFKFDQVEKLTIKMRKIN